MSTTTETSRRHAIACFFQQCAMTLGAWLLLAACITVIAEPTNDAVVFGPPDHTLSLLSGSDTRIMTTGPGYLIVRGSEPGFVRALYANGAVLVLPARSGGCFSRDAKPLWQPS